MGTSANIVAGLTSFSINGSDVGFLEGGVSVRHNGEFIDIMADQVTGVVRKIRQMERMYIRTTLLEVTLSRLREAFMLPLANLSGSTLTLGYSNACWVDEVELVIVGASPGCGTRTWTFNNCVKFGEVTYNMKRDEHTKFEIEFEALKDSNGNFGTVVDS